MSAESEIKLINNNNKRILPTSAVLKGFSPGLNGLTGQILFCRCGIMSSKHAVACCIENSKLSFSFYSISFVQKHHKAVF